MEKENYYCPGRKLWAFIGFKIIMLCYCAWESQWIDGVWKGEQTRWRKMKVVRPKKRLKIEDQRKERNN